MKTVPFDEGFKERLKDPEYAFTVIRAISVDYERDIDALEAKVKAQAELLERAVESINFLIVYGEQFPIKRARAEILMADLEKLQSEEAGEKE